MGGGQLQSEAAQGEKVSGVGGEKNWGKYLLIGTVPDLSPTENAGQGLKIDQQKEKFTKKRGDHCRKNV